MKRLGLVIAFISSLFAVKAQPLELTVTPQVVGTDLHITFYVNNTGPTESVGAWDIPILIDTVGLDMAGMSVIQGPNFSSASGSGFYLDQQAVLINASLINFRISPDYATNNPLDPSLGESIVTGNNYEIGTISIPINECKNDLMLQWVPGGDPQEGARLDWVGNNLDPMARNAPVSPFSVNFPSLVVTNSNNSGCGSLRNAIETANANPGPDVIDMSALVPFTPGVDDIILASPLTFTDNYTTFDFGPNTPCGGIVTLVGDGTFDAFVLDDVEGIQIEKFTIQNFERGIFIDRGRSNIVQCNFIGTDATASGAAGTGNEIGIDVLNSPLNLIGDSLSLGPFRGNVISGNDAEGVRIRQDSPFNTIAANVIGADANATTRVPNGGNGVLITEGAGETLIGSRNGSGNIISGNNENGVEIIGGSRNVFYKNIIGSNTTNSNSIHNVLDGISISNSNMNFIGDSLNDRGNIISGNREAGIHIQNSDTNRISANVIGLGFDGETAVPNRRGVLLNNDATRTVIGSLRGYGGANIISANDGPGVTINGSATSGNYVFRNYIGVDANIHDAANNGANILLSGETTSNVIGNNIIAYATYGISVQDDSESNFWGVNSIYSNVQSGIFFDDLGDNDQQDGILPPDNLAFDVTTLTGTARPGAQIQIYADTANQGASFLDTTFANAAGVWTKTFTVAQLQAEVDAGRSFITAFQTDLSTITNINSSIFSSPIPICVPPTADIQNPSGGSWEFCRGDTLSITSDYVAGATYSFYLESTGNMIANVTDSTANLVQGDFPAAPAAITDNLIVEVEILPAGCVMRDTVQVDLRPSILLSRGLSNPQDICANGSKAMNGQSPTTGAGIWSTLGDGSFSPDPNTLNAVYTPGVNDIAAGSTRLVLTSDNNGGCQAVTDTLDIVVSPAPTIDLGENFTICDGDDASLKATVTIVDAINWQAGGSGGFVTNPMDFTEAVYQPSAFDYTLGLTGDSIKITAVGSAPSGSSCEDVVDSVYIKITNTQQVDAGPDTVACTPINVDLEATSFPGYEYAWTRAEGGVATAPTANDSVYTATQVGKYYVDVNSPSGGCASRDSVVVSTTPPLIDPDVIFFSANSTSVTFAWDSVAGAADYTLTIDTCRYPDLSSCTPLPSVTFPNNGPFRYTQGNLSVGDSVNFTVVANGVCGGTTNPMSAHGVADSCSAEFSGLQPQYCTASFLDELYPAFNGGVFTATPVPSAVKYSGSFYYFDPAEAGPGDHWVYYENCNGLRDSAMTTVLSAPCVTEVVNDSTASAIDAPRGIYTNCDGEIFTSSAQINSIVKIDTFGVATIVAGDSTTSGNTDGPVSIATINDPIGLVVMPDETIYFINSGNHTIRRISGGVVTTVAGSGVVGTGTVADDGIGVAARFVRPYGMALSKDLSTLYITDEHRLRAVDLVTFQVTTLAGTGAAGDAVGTPAVTRFDEPSHLVADANNVYITDKRNRKIKRYDITSTLTEDYVFTGGFLPPYEGQKDLASAFSPRGISLDENGGIFIADESTCAISRLEDDTVSLFSGDYGDCDDITGNATSSRFDAPDGLSVFSKGFLDVADAGNDKIKRIAINDFLKSPLRELDTVYCFGDAPDTLASSVNTLGTYSGTGISNSGGYWIFTPNTTGNYDVCYEYEIGYCSESLCLNVTVAPQPVVDLGMDTTIICSDQYGVDSLIVDSTLADIDWRVNGTLDPGNEWFRILDTAPARYTVAVTDTNGCMAYDTIRIVLSQSTVEAGTPPANLCAFTDYEISDATINGSSTTPSSYTIGWSPSVGLNRIDTLHPVVNYRDTTLITYYLSVTDTAGCVDTDSIKFTIEPLPEVYAATDPVEDTLFCLGNTIQLTDTVSGNAASYSWTPTTGVANPSWKTTNVTPTDTTEYFVNYTDANGCQARDSITVYPIQIGGQITLTQDTACVGDMITATINVTGSPEGRLSYNWESQGYGASNTFSFTLTTPVDSVISLAVYDSTRGCAPLLLRDTLFANKLRVSLIDSIYLCNPDTAFLDATITGGIPPYNITWTGSAGDYISDPGMEDTRVQPANNGANYFYIDVQESGVANCSFTDSVNVYRAPLVTVDARTIPVADTIFCLGETVQMTGVPGNVLIGTETFSWMPTTGVSNPVWQLTDVTPVDTTAYSVLFTDANGCTATDSVRLYPVDFAATVSFSTDTACVGNNVTATATVNGSPYNRLSYNWNSTGFGVSNTFNFDVLFQRDTTITLEVYDSTAQCTPKSYTATLQVNDLSINLADSIYVCNLDTASISATISGGKTPYTILWTAPGADYISDNTITNPEIYPSSAGVNYFYIGVSDSPLMSGGNCSARDSINIYKADPITVQAQAVPQEDTIICLGDAVDLAARAIPTSPGGVYSWTQSEDGTFARTGQNITVTPVDTATYYAAYTDANGCQSSLDSVTVYPQQLQAEITYSKDTACVGENITVYAGVNGGVGPYSYSWNDNTSYSAMTTTSVMPSADTTIVLIVYDSASGCSSRVTDVLEVSDLAVTFVNDSLFVCYEDSTALEAQITGGKPAYTINWSGPAGDYIEYPNNATTGVATQNPGSNTFSISITDQPIGAAAAGCTVTGDVVVFMNDELTVDAGVDTSICSGNPVVRNAIPGGGQGVYTQGWTDGGAVNQAGATLNTTPTTSPVEYYAGVQDGYGCTALDTMEVTVLDLQITLTTQFNDICPGTRDSVYATVTSGGSGRYSYSFDGGTSFIANAFVIVYPRQDTTVNVIVKDSAGCDRNESVDINVEEFSIDVGDDAALCEDATDPATGTLGHNFIVDVQGGSAPFTDTWTILSPPADPSDVVRNSQFDITIVADNSPGDFHEYVLTVQDAAGCLDRDTISIYLSTTFVTFTGPLTGGPYTICDGQQFVLGSGSGSLTTTGGVPPYTTTWSSTPTTNVDGSTDDTPTFQSNGPGTFVFSKLLVDSIGCQPRYLGGGQDVTVNVNASPDITFDVTNAFAIEMDTSDYCPGETFTISNTATNPAGTTYEWYYDDLSAVPTTGTSVVDNTEGKYYHLVDDGSGCTRLDSVYMNELAPTSVMIDPIAPGICSNQEIQVTTTYAPTGGTFAWTTNGNGTITDVTTEGDQIAYTQTSSDPTPLSFDVTYTTSCGTFSAPTMTLTTVPSPTAGLSFSSTSLLPTDTITVMDTSVYPNGWQSSEFYFENGIQNGVPNETATGAAPFDAFDVRFDDPGTQRVCLKVVENTGCEDSICVAINVISSQVYYIPNVFSPYASNVENQVAKVYGPTIVPDNFNFEVYNRWGELIFQSQNFTEMNTVGWNGLNQNTGVIEINGVYTYVVNLTFDDGSELQGSGTITIVK